LPGRGSPTTCPSLCEGYTLAQAQEWIPRVDLSRGHIQSVRGVVYCPHRDMGVGNGTGTEVGSQMGLGAQRLERHGSRPLGGITSGMGAAAVELLDQ
jgi:hypothetical protein